MARFGDTHRAGALLAVALAALVAPGCRRRTPPERAPAAPGAAEPSVVCERLVLAEEHVLAGPEASPEGAAVVATPEGAVAAWLEHPEGRGTVAMLRAIAPSGRPAGPARPAIELAPPPTPATPPSVAFADGRGWLVAWDEATGCRAASFDASGAVIASSRRELGREACFAAAVEPGGMPTALQSAPAGWMSVPLRTASASDVPVAPAGGRWLARASDGVTAYVVDDRALFVRRPGGPARAAVAQAPGTVRALALERMAGGYLLAWAHEGGRGTSVLRLSDELRPVGDPEQFAAGGAAVAVAPTRGEAWLALGDEAGAVEIARWRRDGRSQGVAAMRPGRVDGVAIAPVPPGAVVVFALAREQARSIHVFGARCAPADGSPRPR